jgi:lipopolysaccharide export LptBFGC system permease protein LptF
MIETDELSTAQLVQRLTQQTSTLVKQEVRLAQLELTTKAKRAGIGIGAFGAAGVLAFYAVGVLLAAAVLGLANAVSAWLAALIVAGALLLVALGLAVFGKTQISKATPPAPAQAIASSKQDVAAIKRAAGR